MLYADAGGGNLHPRATVAELADLLRPDARSVHPNSVKQKDQVGHWYTAQLIHYGLPQTKDKNAAKVRLLNALNSFKLEVPVWVLKVESELKKEWEAQNRKLKKVYAKGTMKGSIEPVEKAKGARKPNNDVNITVNLSLSSGLSMVQQLGIVDTAISSPAPSPGKRKRGETSDAKPKQGSKQAKIKSTPRGQTSRLPVSPYMSERKVKTEPVLSPATPTARRITKIKTEPSPRKSQSIKLERHMSLSPPIEPRRIKLSPEREHGNILLSGSYRITCPVATSTFQGLSPSSLHLTVCRDHHRGVWWASFIWGDWDCCIQLNPGPEFSTLGSPCTLGWRLRDLEDGDLKFGRGCTGIMTFYANQTIRATLYEVPGVGDIEFWGSRMEEAWVREDKGDEFQDEWDGFVREAYGR